MQALAIHVGGGIAGLVTCPFLIYNGIFYKQDQHSAMVKTVIQPSNYLFKLKFVCN